MRNFMKTGNLYILLLGVLFWAVGVSSCDRSPEHRTTIAVVPKADDASVAEAKAAALAARDMYGIAVRWDVSRNLTAESQAELIGKLAAAGVDGILLSCIDAEAEVLREAIDAAVAAGIVVGTFDSDAPESGRSFYIGSDNTAAGELAARTLRALCEETGRSATGVGVFGGAEGDAAMTQRLAGFLSVVPDTAATFWANGAGSSAGRTQVVDFLTKEAQRPINGVVFLSGETVVDGPGTMARLDSLCRPATDNDGAAAAAVFFDPSEPVLEFVAEMPHCAAIRQDFGAMVYGGIERLLHAIRGESFGEAVTYTPVEVVR